MSWHEYDLAASIVVEAAFIAVLVILPVIFGLLAWDMRRPKKVKRPAHLRQGTHVKVLPQYGPELPPLNIPTRLADQFCVVGTDLVCATHNANGVHYNADAGCRWVPTVSVYDQDAE